MSALLKLTSNTEQAFEAATHRWETVAGTRLERQVLDVATEVAQYAAEAIRQESSGVAAWDPIRSTVRVAEQDDDVVIAMAAEAFDVEYGSYRIKTADDGGRLFDDTGEAQFEDVAPHPVVRPALNRYARDLQTYFEDMLAESLFG